MDPNSVFAKTKEGEEAVRQRTRLVQRNLRNILIMVDGQATVADLARRFGETNATHAALNELNTCGFIVQTDSASATGAEPPSEENSVVKAEEIPVLTSAVASTPFSEPTSLLEHHSLPPEFDDAPPVLQEYESLPPTFNPAEAWQSSSSSHVSPGMLDKVKKASLSVGVKLSDWTKRKAQAEEQQIVPVEVESIGRGQRIPMPWPMLVLLTLAGLCLLSLLAVMLFPYERYLPGIERKASDALKDPVKIGTIGFSFLPRPHIALGNIKVGQAEHLTIAKAMAVPDILSLLGESTIVSELVIEKPLIKSSGLSHLAQAGSSPGMIIQHITLNGLAFVVGKTSYSGMNGEITMNAAGAPEKILLRDAEGFLKIELTPMGEIFQIAVSGSAWRSSTRPSFTFDKFDAQGELKPDRLVLGRLDGRAYDGLVEGNMSLEWAGSANLKGEFVLKRLNTAKLLSAFESDFSGEGDLSGKIRLDSQAEIPGKLNDSLRYEAMFEVGRGEIKGFDLGEATRNTGRSPTQGGSTKFEQFKGSLLGDSQGMRLSNLHMNSGLLQAGGNFHVAHDKQLKGAVEVEFKGSAKTLKVSLLVGGTSKIPLLTPARAK